MSSRLGASAWGLVLAAGLLLLPPDARATEVGDGDELSVKLREDALVCIHTPPPVTPDPACAVFGTPAPSDSAKGPIRVINSGVIRLSASDRSALAVTVLVQAKVPFVAEPETNKDAMDYAREYAGGVAKSLAPARVHGGGPTASLWRVNGIPLVRFSFDLDGVPEDKRLMQHHVGFVASSRDARYTLSFSSRTSDADVVDVFASDSIASIRLPHRAPTRSYLVGYWAGMLLGAVLAVAVPAIVVVVLLRRGRRRQRLAAPPR